MSLVFLFAGAIEAATQRTPRLAQDLQGVGSDLDRDGVLPPPFVRVTPNLAGREGDTWHHPPSGMYVMRTEHRPVLLTTGGCSLCGLNHMDVARTYIFMVGPELEAGVYERYTPVRLEFGGSLSTDEGA